MTIQMTIDPRFCGPPTSGNGGYVCGLVAGLLSGAVEVTLRRPPPLDTPMKVEVIDCERVCLVDETGLIAEGRSSTLAKTVASHPSFAQARSASEHYAGFDRHFYPTCFVCGPARRPGDGLRIFAGPLKGENGVAATWIPDRSLSDESGSVKEEFVWAALDCPGYFAINAKRQRYMLLGRMTAAVYARPFPGDRCVVAAWHIGSQGRKHFAETALLSETGRVLGNSRATWIEIDPPV